MVQAHRSRLLIWLVGRAARPQTEWRRPRQEPSGRRRRLQGSQDDLIAFSFRSPFGA
jgi:ribosomal protein L32E